jgi:hypothetical protein
VDTCFVKSELTLFFKGCGVLIMTLDVSPLIQEWEVTPKYRRLKAILKLIKGLRRQFELHYSVKWAQRPLCPSLPALEPVDYVWHPDLFIEAATINMN